MSEWNIRQSGLKQLMMCPRRYQYETIEGIDRGPVSAAMFAGTAFHAGVEIAVKHYMSTGSWPAPEAAGDLFLAGWKATEVRTEAEGGVRWDEPAEKLAASVYPGYEYWLAELAPTLRPVASEIKFRGVPVSDEIRIEGTIDLVEQGGIIRDYKTTGRRFQKTDVARDVQASMYSLAYKNMYGIAPKSFTFEVFVRGNDVLYERYEAQRTPEQLERFVGLLESWKVLLDAGIDLPMNPGGWWCSVRYCSFWDRCPMGAGPMRKASAQTSKQDAPGQAGVTNDGPEPKRTAPAAAPVESGSPQGDTGEEGPWSLAPPAPPDPYELLEPGSNGPGGLDPAEVLWPSHTPEAAKLLGSTPAISQAHKRAKKKEGK